MPDKIKKPYTVVCNGKKYEKSTAFVVNVSKMALKTLILCFRVLKSSSTVVETIKNEPSDPFLLEFNTQLVETLYYLVTTTLPRGPRHEQNWNLCPSNIKDFV